MINKILSNDWENKLFTINKTIIIIILAGVLFWGFQSGFFISIFSGPVTATPLPSGIVLFYGQGCPHCADVEKFIAQNSKALAVGYDFAQYL